MIQNFSLQTEDLRHHTVGFPVVDGCSLLLDRSGWRGYLERFERNAPSYLWHFAPAWCRYFGADLVEFKKQLHLCFESGVQHLIENIPPVRIDEYVTSRKSQGIVHEFLMGTPAPHEIFSSINAWLAEAIMPYRDFLSLWWGIDLSNVSKLSVQLTEAIEADAMGINCIPFLDGVDPVDPKFNEFWGMTEASGLLVWMHAGKNFASNSRGTVSMEHINNLATQFPKMKIVVGHAGWPEIDAMVSLAELHPNIFLEFSSHRPRTIRVENGWGPMLNEASSVVQNKILFGSSTWVNPVGTAALAKEVEQLGLSRSTSRAWLSGNSSRLWAERYL